MSTEKTTGKLAVKRSINGELIEEFSTENVQLYLHAFHTIGEAPAVFVSYRESFADGKHIVNLTPNGQETLDYVSKDGKRFVATGTIELTVSRYQSRQEGVINATLKDTSGRLFDLKGTYEGETPLT